MRSPPNSSSIPVLTFFTNNFPKAFEISLLKIQSFKKESRRQSDQSAEEKWAAIRAKKSLGTRSKKILGSE